MDVTDKGFLFGSITKRWVGNQEMALRVNAHIRSVTDGKCVDLSAYQNEESIAEADKVKVYQDILKVILKPEPNYSELKGSVPTGQWVQPTVAAPKVEEAKPNRFRRFEKPVAAAPPSQGEETKAAPAPSVAPAAVPVAVQQRDRGGPSVMAMQIAEMIDRAMWVNEDRIRQIAREEADKAVRERFKALAG